MPNPLTRLLHHEDDPDSSADAKDKAAATPDAKDAPAATPDASATKTQSASDDNAQTLNAAALGWALTELLGRSFILKEFGFRKNPPAVQDFSHGLLVLPAIRSDRAQVRAVMARIQFLATQLGVDSSKIDHVGDEYDNKLYTDVLKDKVIALCKDVPDPKKDGTYDAICQEMNERLYYWDQKIQDALQQKAASVYNAYMIGRSLAALRWYYGLPDTFSQQMQEKILSEASLKRLCEHIELLTPILNSLATGALVNSVQVWGNAFLGLDGTVPPGKDGIVPVALEQQAVIWHDLLTGARDPITYVAPDKASWQYIWQVIRSSWLIALFWILPIILLVVVFILPKLDITVRTIIAFTGGFVSLGGAIVWANAIWQTAIKNVDATIGGVESTLMTMIWVSAQQPAINDATCIPPSEGKPSSP